MLSNIPYCDQCIQKSKVIDSDEVSNQCLFGNKTPLFFHKGRSWESLLLHGHFLEEEYIFREAQSAKKLLKNKFRLIIIQNHQFHFSKKTGVLNLSFQEINVNKNKKQKAINFFYPSKSWWCINWKNGWKVLICLCRKLKHVTANVWYYVRKPLEWGQQRVFVNLPGWKQKRELLNVAQFIRFSR